MTYRFVNEHCHDYAITLMCRVLRVARAGSYAWQHEPVSDHARTTRPNRMWQSDFT